MVPVRDYKSLWEYIVSQIVEITQVLCVDDETELSKKISEVANGENILVAPFPNADLDAMDEDNLGDIDQCVIYVLQKIDLRNVTDTEVMNERAMTQLLMKKVREQMLELASQWENQTAHSRLMKQMIRGKQHIDRERNYLGCNGYSLSFGLRTNGL